MRFPHKPALECSRHGEAQPRKWVTRPGKGFDFVPYLTGSAIELDQEKLLSALDVQLGRGVDETACGGRIDDIHDPAQVEGPESQSANFNGNHLAGRNCGIRIGHSHPAEVELRPALERLLRNLKCSHAVAQKRARTVVFLATRMLTRARGGR